MDSLEIEPEHLNRWAVLTSCQQTFLNEIYLVCFNGKRTEWALVVTTGDKVYAVGDIPAWASDRETKGVSEPLEIAKLSGRGVVGLASGSEHCLALTGRGGVLSWGNNKFGQLGLGSTESSRVPVQLPVLSHVTSVTCGWYFSLALRRHEVYAWGSGGRGECGSDGGDVSSPRRVVFPAGIALTSVACGHHHAAAVGCDGKVYCWGSNGASQLGRGSEDGGINSEPRPVELPSAASQVCCTRSGTVALTTDGQVWAWGYNRGGQLGVGLTENRVTTPKPVTGLERVTSIIYASTQDYLLARTDSTTFIWGEVDGYIVTAPRAFDCVAEALANKGTPTICIRGRSGPSLTYLDFTSQFNLAEHSDVTVVLRDCRVFCHSVILRRASPLLRRMLTGVWHRSGERVLRLEGYRPASYMAFLGYLYTGRLNCESQEELPELYKMSRSFEVEGLRREVVAAVSRSLSPSNALSFYKAALDSSAQELEDLISKFIVEHFVEIGKTDSFRALGDVLIAKLTLLYLDSK